MQIAPRARFDALFDGGVWVETPLSDPPADPLKFRDQKRYPDRIRDARAGTGEHEALLVARGEIGGLRTVAACQNFGFMAGSMGMAVGDALITAADTPSARGRRSSFSAPQAGRGCKKGFCR